MSPDDHDKQAEALRIALLETLMARTPLPTGSILAVFAQAMASIAGAEAQDEKPDYGKMWDTLRPFFIETAAEYQDKVNWAINQNEYGAN